MFHGKHFGGWSDAFGVRAEGREHLVFGRIEHVVEGHGGFNETEVWADVAAGSHGYAKRSRLPKPIDGECTQATFFSCPGASYLHPLVSNREGSRCKARRRCCKKA